MGDATTAVRAQYEEFPYPRRDPEDERKRLIRTSLGAVDVLQHYCFRGRNVLRDGGNILVAGGGTGDAAIYLAEQLRNTDAQVYYLDLSAAAMEIAQKRADVRGLTNITWRLGSLLNLAETGWPQFDFIDCCGVLHHLADPPAGLQVLRDALRPGGGMYLMVYAQYGRTGIYQVQDLMRRVLGNEDALTDRVMLARMILEDLPDTNWLYRAAGRGTRKGWRDPAELYDLFLHPQDQAYTVDGLYELLDGAGLNKVVYTTNFRVLYRPEAFLPPGPVLDRIQAMPTREQEAIAELVHGSLANHALLLSSATDSVASLDDWSMVPLVPERVANPEMFALLDGLKDWEFSTKGLVDLTLSPSAKARKAFAMIDGKRSLVDIYNAVGHSVEDEFRVLFAALCDWSNCVLLKAAGKGKRR